MKRQLKLRGAGGAQRLGPRPHGEAEDSPGDFGRVDEREDAASAAARAVEDLETSGAAQQLGQPSSASPQKFGAREWMQYTTPRTTTLPRGGWLAVTVSDFKLTLQLAAPEVTSSLQAAKSHLEAARTIQTAEDRSAILQAQRLDADQLDER